MSKSSDAACFPVREAASNGVVQGDNPLHFTLPLFIVQITLVLAITRVLAFLFKPLRQPRVLAEVIGGVLLGPTALGRNKAFLNAIFPEDSLTLLSTIANLGLLFFLFMVGLELDFKEIKKSGKLAVVIALCGIAVPFTATVPLARLFQKALSLQGKLTHLVVFMGVPMSITAFPVLVRIMAERKILTTELGKIIVPAAAINDVFAWVLLAIGVSISGSSTRAATPAFVLLLGFGFVICMMFAGKWALEWIARKAHARDNVTDIYVCTVIVGVLLAGFTTDAIGIHPLFGAFMFGLVFPSQGQLAKMLIERVEDFVTVLMLPLFFAFSGLRTNLGSINSGTAAGLLLLAVVTASIGKISATAGIALSFKFQRHEALAFGVLMNTKGLVELIVLNVGKDLGVFDEQTFAILVLMCLVLIFFTTPLVMALYKPARNPTSYKNCKLDGCLLGKEESKLHVLVCVHGTRHISVLLNLVDACKSAKKSSLRVCVMHLVELTNRTSTILAMSKDTLQYSSNEDNVFITFKAYGRLAKVPVQTISSVSDLANMHEDIYNAASEKKVAFIILPYIMQQREDGSFAYVNQAFNNVYNKVLQHAPCSVGVFVDKGAWGSNELLETDAPQKVIVLFFGGPDDREALALGCRFAENPSVKLCVFRLISSKSQNNGTITLNLDLLARQETQSENLSPHIQVQDEYLLDEKSLGPIKDLPKGVDMQAKRCIFYHEHHYEDPIDATTCLAKSSKDSLILVGRRGHHDMQVIGSIDRYQEHIELGIIGNSLATCVEVESSIVVMQQYNWFMN